MRLHWKQKNLDYFKHLNISIQDGSATISTILAVSSLQNADLNLVKQIQLICWGHSLKKVKILFIKYPNLKVVYIYRQSPVKSPDIKTL